MAWIQHFRSTGPLDGDESGYLATASSDSSALVHHGVISLAHTVVTQPYGAPFVPLVSSLFQAIFGRTVFMGFVGLAFFAVVLVLATYGVARQLTTSGWAALAAVVTGCLPAVLGYTRFFEFAVPSAAVMTAALWALLRSDHLRRPGWAVLFGTLVGCLALTRTMNIAYIPAIALAAVVHVVARRQRGSVVNLALSGVCAVVVAGAWFGPNLRTVGHYLLHFGYGSESSTAGPPASVLSWAFWSKELALIITETGVLLAIVLAVGFVVGIAMFLRGATRRTRDEWLALAGSPVTVLAIVVVEGYLALTSSRNVGTGFALTWLPAAIVLAVAALARLKWPAVRAGLVGLAVVGCVLAVISAADVSSELSTPVTVAIPGLGHQPLLDGESFMYAEVKGDGYPVGSVTSPIAPTSWRNQVRRVTGILLSLAYDHHQSSLLETTELGDLYPANSFTFSAQVDYDRSIRAADLMSGTETEVVKALRTDGADAFLVVHPKTYRATMPSPADLTRAAEATGFTRSGTVNGPDANITVWWRTPRAR